jgi:asparagine N-glycosylation enzyme membrane subunit Stt3
LRKFDVIMPGRIVLVAAGLRLWAPWDDVFGPERVNFLETDAWYHVRLAESQVRNFPHRVTVDPLRRTQRANMWRSPRSSIR